MITDFSNWLGEHVPEVLAALGYVLTLFFIPVVLIRKRQPASALAWSLAIILLPYLGTLLFLAIGVPRISRRLHHKRFHRSRFIEQWIQTTSDQEHHPQPATALEEGREWEGMDRLARVVSAVKLSTGNETTLYDEGIRAFGDKMQAIAGAKHHVHAEYYILQDDKIGRQFIDLLCEKSRQGLEVRLLVDALGSRSATRLLRRLVEAGGRADFFLPIQPWRRRFILNLRNHRKILVCDGRVGFTGGLNVGDEYLGKSKRYGYWRDTQLKIEGPAVLALQRVFVEDWDFSHNEFLSGASYFPDPPRSGSDKLQVIWSGPDQEYNAIHEVYFSAITRSRRELWIATPYLVPDAAILGALKSAALNGVDVRIITQSSPPDHWIAYWASRYYWEELLRCGVKIYQYMRGTIHAKVMIADGRWGSVGSANLDIRSLLLNFELNCLIHSGGLIEQLRQQYRQDLEVCREVSIAQIQNLRWHQHLTSNVCRLMSPIL